MCRRGGRDAAQIRNRNRARPVRGELFPRFSGPAVFVAAAGRDGTCDACVFFYLLASSRAHVENIALFTPVRFALGSIAGRFSMRFVRAQRNRDPPKIRRIRYAWTHLDVADHSNGFSGNRVVAAAVHFKIEFSQRLPSLDPGPAPVPFRTTAVFFSGSLFIFRAPRAVTTK